MWYLRRQVWALGTFDLKSIAPINIDNGEGEVPGLFGHAEADELISFEQCNKLYEHYSPAQSALGGHNTPRDANWIQSGVVFFKLKEIKL